MNIVGIGLPGNTELILIIFVILLLFGAKKLPELARSLGKSLGEFKKGQRDGELPEAPEKKKVENEAKPELRCDDLTEDATFDDELNKSTGKNAAEGSKMTNKDAASATDQKQQ